MRDFRLLLELGLWATFAASLLAAPAFEFWKHDTEASRYFTMKALLAGGFLFVGYCIKEKSQ
jgi:hypothetical protein